MSKLSAHLKGGKQAVQSLEPFTVLSPLVTRVLGCNPGPFTLAGTNTYLIGNGRKRILFDTGSGVVAYTANLANAMKHVGCEEIQAIVVSHWHIDHLGGVPSIQAQLKEQVPVYKYVPDTLEPSFRGEGQASPYEIWPKEGFTPLKDGDLLRTQGATLELYYTPGHANDHMIAVIAEENAMLSADNVLGQGTGVFREFGPYVRSLQRMLDLKPGRVYPAHGPVIEDGPGRIREYIQHRLERVSQVESVLKSAGEGCLLTLEEITRKVYPADLAEELFFPATKNTESVLEYLVELEVVENSSGRWKLVPGRSSL